MVKDLLRLYDVIFCHAERCNIRRDRRMYRTDNPEKVVVPFNDLNALHAPLREAMEASFAERLDRSDFILGESVIDFED